MRGRPELYTSYGQDMAMFNTPAKKVGVVAVVAVAVLVGFRGDTNLLTVLATGFAASIGAIGLNLVTGYAGQVSLGHAFFMGVGAYTAAAISGDPEGRTIGFGMTQLPLWLPAAGIAAALAGLLVAPLAVRLRGLYLAIVTLGLVFIGQHVFKEWNTLTGGPGVGRSVAVPHIGPWRFNLPGSLFGIDFTKAQKLYLLLLVLLIVAAVVARNIARSDVGRAFAAVRDRDVAAEVIGVDLTKTKALAFTISSFYAGVAGALLYTVSGFVEPGTFSLLLSVQFIAMVLIGGVATISGSIMGALFISYLGKFTRDVAGDLPFVASLTGGGGAFNVFQLEAILYGLLIIGFLIFEPRGLFGIWIRFRNYWKGWPFSY